MLDKSLIWTLLYTILLYTYINNDLYRVKRRVADRSEVRYRRKERINIYRTIADYIER